MANLSTIAGNIFADSGIDPINVVLNTGSYSNPAWITALSWTKISDRPTTLAGYGISDAVPSSRTLTINGTSYDLSANRSWTIAAGVSSIIAGTGISVSGSGNITVTNTGVLSINGSTGAITGIITTSNYNSYSPTLIGGGASGTWGINITGTAGSISGFNNPTTSPTGNTIVYRDPNGYVFGNYINMTDDGNPGSGTAITSFITKQGDNYYRAVSPTNAMVSIRGVASGSWGISITGNSSNITAYTINQNLSTTSSPSFSELNLGYSLHVNTANNAASASGGITLWGGGDTTTSYLGFKNSTSSGWGVHGAIAAGEYATYFVMDTITRGWIFRYANVGGGDFSGTNVASISNTGVITASSFVGALTGTATGNVVSRIYSNWNDNTVINNVVGLLAWKNYNNSHVIFDASAGISPNGTSVNQTNAQNAWVGTFPTLMGWNGAGTYGVRVDSARVADNITAYTINQSVGTGNSPTFVNQVLSGRLNFGTNGATPYLDATGTSSGISFGGWESSSLRQYGVFTELENVGGNYSKLTLNWHTGIRIGASPLYGGTRFYNDAAGNGSSTMIFSVGNGDSNVRVANTLFISGNTALHAGNYNSYAPTLTGGGASGTWGISITGSAGSASSASTAGTVTHNASRTDSAWYNAVWAAGTPSPMYSCDAVQIQSNTGSIRANIFYDNQDTAYYLNPNNTTFSAVLSGTIRLEAGAFGTNSRSPSSQGPISRTFAPQGAANSFQGGNVTGSIKIRLPFRANDCMWSMKIRIYEYTNNATSEYTIGNYSYSAGAYHRGAYYMGGTGSIPQTVRFGNDGTYDCVWIGETSYTWSHPVVGVVDFMGGYVRCDVATVANNWDVTFVTSFGTIGDSVTPSIRFSDVYASSLYSAGNAVITTANIGSQSVSFANTASRAYYSLDGFINTGTHAVTYIQNELPAANNGAGTGRVVLRQWCSEPGVSWDYAGFGYNVENDGGSPGGFGRFNGSFGQAYMRMSPSGDWYFYNTNTSGTRYSTMHLTSAGNASFGGSITASGDVTAYSDIRIKKNIETIAGALDKVIALRGVYYNRTDNGDTTQKLGVIAQEIQKILPQVVNENSDGMLSVSYGNIVGVLIEAIKEQQTQIEELKKSIN